MCRTRIWYVYTVGHSSIYTRLHKKPAEKHNWGNVIKKKKLEITCDRHLIITSWKALSIAPSLLFSSMAEQQAVAVWCSLAVLQKCILQQIPKNRSLITLRTTQCYQAQVSWLRNCKINGKSKQQRQISDVYQLSIIPSSSFIHKVNSDSFFWG